MNIIVVKNISFPSSVDFWIFTDVCEINGRIVHFRPLLYKEKNKLTITRPKVKYNDIIYNTETNVLNKSDKERLIIHTTLEEFMAENFELFI